MIVVALPLLLGYYAYTQAAAKPQAPPELRAVHPAPPASIQFRGKEINISGFENPLRKDQAAFKKHVGAGGEIYIKNCMYCHGDNLDGKGHFAQRVSISARQLRRSRHDRHAPGGLSVLAHRQGRPGAAEESSPNSVMPAWEDRLTEEQIWQVVMYLYDATGQQPRRWEAH